MDLVSNVIQEGVRFIHKDYPYLIYTFGKSNEHGIEISWIEQDEQISTIYGLDTCKEFMNDGTWMKIN